MSCGLHHDTCSEEQGGDDRKRLEEAAAYVEAAGKAAGGGGKMWRKAEWGGDVETKEEVHCIAVGEGKYIGVADVVFEVVVFAVAAHAVGDAAVAAFGAVVVLVAACHPHEVEEPQLPQINGQTHPLRKSCK